MADLMDCVRSLVPGRVRLRHPEIKSLDADQIEFVKACLGNIEAVYSVDINPRVGSILIRWYPEKMSVEECIDMLEQYAMMLAGSLQSEEPTCMDKVAYCADRVVKKATRLVGCVAVRLAKPGVHSERWVLRQANNRVMLAALGLSLAGIMGVGGYAVHAMAGVAFLGLLGMHLWSNRALL